MGGRRLLHHVYGRIDRGETPLDQFGPNTFVALEDGARIIGLTPALKLAGQTVVLTPVKADARINAKIVFGHESDARLKPMIPTVENCLGSVEDALGLLRPLFP